MNNAFRALFGPFSDFSFETVHACQVKCLGRLQTILSRFLHIVDIKVS